MGWVGLDLWRHLFYEHCSAVLIMADKIQNSNHRMRLWLSVNQSFTLPCFSCIISPSILHNGQRSCHWQCQADWPTIFISFVFTLWLALCWSHGTTIGWSILKKGKLHKKHRKNCECCHHHSLFKGHNVNVNIVVLNCQKWNQCLKCQVSGHKSLGLLFEDCSLREFSKCYGHCHCHCNCHWSGHVFSSDVF